MSTPVTTSINAVDYEYGLAPEGSRPITTVSRTCRTAYHHENPRGLGGSPEQAYRIDENSANAIRESGDPATIARLTRRYVYVVLLERNGDTVHTEICHGRWDWALHSCGCENDMRWTDGPWERLEMCNDAMWKFLDSEVSA